MRARKHDSSRALVAGALTVALAAVVVAGCGGSQADPDVARVGGSRIGEHALRHWTVAFERYGVQAGAGLDAGGSAAQRAEEYLIGAHWLLAEAARLGVAPNRQAVRERVAQEREAVPGGSSGYAQSLAGTSRTPADARYEAEIALAQHALRDVAIARAGAVPAAAVAVAYRAEVARYRTPEHRYVDLVERLPSATAARAVGRRLGTGARFAARAYHENQVRPARFDPHTVKGRLVRAIFAAPPGVLVGPLPLARQWTLFVVRRVVPAGVLPLAVVRASIIARLGAQRESRALRGFEAAMLARRRPLTRCAPYHVVSLCAGQHGGAGIVLSLAPAIN